MATIPAYDSLLSFASFASFGDQNLVREFAPCHARERTQRPPIKDAAHASD